MLTRNYDPAQGRFTSQDVLFGSELDPASLNQFVYAQDSPIDYIDPSGMRIEGDIGYCLNKALCQTPINETYLWDLPVHTVVGLARLTWNSTVTLLYNPKRFARQWKDNVVGGYELVTNPGALVVRAVKNIAANCRRGAFHCGEAVGETAGAVYLIAEGGAALFSRLGRLEVAEGLAEEDGFVNLASDGKTRHILDGEQRADGKWDGRHRFPGRPGKSSFPADWSDGKIMHNVSDIATDRDLVWHGPKGSYDEFGNPTRFKVWGERGGICIRVVAEPAGEGIITAFPDPGLC